MAPSLDPSPATPDSLSRPRPRPPRSPGHLAQIRAQNRRRAYLERHPSYFQSSEHELADPLLYDFLIRRFQTPAEREADGREKGYARVLEGSLLRGEERLAKLRAQTAGRYGEDGTGVGSGGGGAGAEAEGEEEEEEDEDEDEDEEAGMTGGGGGGDPRAGNGTDPEPGTTFSSLAAELAAPPRTREEGRAQWEAFLRDRFIRGEDDEFEYGAVDGDDEYDVLERIDREEAWFEDEEPRWASSGASASGSGSGSEADEGEEERGGGRGGGRGRRGEERVLQGETGVQDF